MVQGKTQKRERPSIATRPSSDVLSLADRQSGAPAAAGEWPKKISRAWHRQLTAIFTTGRLLIEAKAALPHGSFISMIEAELPFKARTAQMLMVIASDQRLLDANHGSHLPPSWRTLFELTKVSDEAFAAGIADGTIHAEMDRKGLHGFIKTSGCWDWYTPPEIIEPARRALGGTIDFDPASCAAANQVVRASRFFTKADDALRREWPAPARIWMYPPYAHPLIDQFVDRFIADIARGSSGIVLVNSATDTRWFHTLLAGASAICFVLGRVAFIDTDGSHRGKPLQGQTVFFFGADDAAFCEAFAPIGKVSSWSATRLEGRA